MRNGTYILSGDSSSPHVSDTLNSVLDVAVEVLAEYAGIPGNTRIERLARFVAEHLGGEPYGPNARGYFSRSEVAGVWCCGTQVGFRGEGVVDPDVARELGLALFRAAEVAETIETVES